MHWGIREKMKVGDLIYDSHYGRYALVVDTFGSSSYFVVMYDDGSVESNVRINDSEIEVIIESR